ncbi:MAG TPA: MauE/DoxX family redox-associated membrane protein [Kineosporiaceae bacterium]|nr:MauE/DoxX family redox-associated membrane protein [Kineosporiaceae bacterium]
MNLSVPAPGTRSALERPPWLRAAQPWLSLAARLVLAVVFFAAGVPKLMDPDGTVRSVRAFRLVPEVFVPAFGYGLPVLELALALLLLVGLATRVAAGVVAVLLVMFMIGIAAAWARGLSIECGCFGAPTGPVVDPTSGYRLDLLRDAGLLVLALWLVVRPASTFSLDARLGLGA